MLHYSIKDIGSLRSKLDCTEYEELLEQDYDERFRLEACFLCEEPLLEGEYRYCFGCWGGFN